MRRFVEESKLLSLKKLLRSRDLERSSRRFVSRDCSTYLKMLLTLTDPYFAKSLLILASGKRKYIPEGLSKEFYSTFCSFTCVLYTGAGNSRSLAPIPSSILVGVSVWSNSGRVSYYV